MAASDQTPPCRHGRSSSRANEAPAAKRYRSRDGRSPHGVRGRSALPPQQREATGFSGSFQPDPRLGDLRSWLLLARSSKLQARHRSERQPRLLDREDRREQGARFEKMPRASEEGPKGSHGLGMQDSESRLARFAAQKKGRSSLDSACAPSIERPTRLSTCVRCS